MPATVVDTGVLIGAADASDHNHDAALEIVTAIDRGDLPTGRVTNYVVLEALNWIHECKRHATGVDFYRRLSRGYSGSQAPGWPHMRGLACSPAD